MNLDAITLSSLEDEYNQLTSIAHRKKYAQFFTPYPIADLMAKWILGNNLLKSVLDPAFGLGVFSRVILKYNQNVTIKGFEIDENIFSKAVSYFTSYPNVNITLKDYMFNDWSNKYDAIICNPPYFKFHDYDNKSILTEISKRLSLKLSGFTNLYTLFLLKSVSQLNKNGRLAYIVPSEFLNSDYGTAIKENLIKSNYLRFIIVINFEENVFDEALTTACILLCSNDNKVNGVKFINVNTLSDLDTIKPIISEYPNASGLGNFISNDQLDPKIKWRGYYQTRNSIQFNNLVPFSKYAKVVRGIATGSNEYFTFNNDKIKQYKIDKKYLLPCICKAIDVKGNIFTQHNFETLENNNRYTYLLNAKNPMDENVKKYLQKGVEEGIDKKYLTSCRNPWYSLENRPPAPIWVSVFNRSGLKFIRNEANISNLTTFHCVYPNESTIFSNCNINLLFAYLLTNVAKLILQDNQREYGDGLKKFEPNDVNKGMVMDLDLIDDETQLKILKLYDTYRESEINNKPNNHIISAIENIFMGV